MLMVEPYTAAAWAVSVSSMLVVGITGWVGRRVVGYVEETRNEAQAAHETAEKAVRVLRGEEGIDDAGLVEDVRSHRRALVDEGIYPPKATDGGESDA